MTNVTSTLTDAFQNSADVKISNYTFAKETVIVIFCDQMIDEKILTEHAIPMIQSALQHPGSSLQKQLPLPGLKEYTEIDEAVSAVYKGLVVLYFEKMNTLYSINLTKKPNRTPEETKSEVTIKGPRDNFIEDVTVNIALIRKRLPTKSLSVEKLVVGTRSQTTVAILYFQDVANLNTLEEIKHKLQSVETDIVTSGDYMLERILKKSSLFPLYDYTGRPDFAVSALARGRFVLFFDGVSYANIVPVNLFLLMKTSEDNDYPILFSSFERMLRLASFLISSLLPGLWLALTTFHPNQLPFQLLATVVQANIGLPLPSALEMLLMLFLFEIFREAGLRLPSVIGSTIGVVGGLIIGDAAIRAGITSPAMVVIIATSTIATYTLVNQSLVTAVSIIRLIFILSASLLGLFGFFTALFFILLYMANIRPFNTPYLNIGADLKSKNFFKTFFRLRPSAYKKRPTVLDTKDSTRGSDKS